MTQYLFSFKDKVSADTFYDAVSFWSHIFEVSYINTDLSLSVTYNTNLPDSSLKKHIKELKEGNFGIVNIKRVNDNVLTKLKNSELAVH